MLKKHEFEVKKAFGGGIWKRAILCGDEVICFFFVIKLFHESRLRIYVRE